MSKFLQTIFSFKAVPDSDEYGIALAGYVIMWVGAILAAFTAFQQILDIALFYGAQSDALTVDKMFQLTLAVAIFLMGASLTFWYRKKHPNKSTA